MDILQAIILGIVQGLTEFIPVSSTAHLIFATRLTGLSRTLAAEQQTAVIAVIQLGTLAAVFLYFARDIWAICYAFVRDHLLLLRGKTPPGIEGKGLLGSRLSPEAKLGWLIFIGSLPIGVVGLVFKKQIEGTFTKNLWVIATMMIVVGILLTIAELVGKRDHGMDQLRISDALAVGFAQVLALIPGSSRSGSTIMGGLFAGLTRETAARFSFSRRGTWFASHFWARWCCVHPSRRALGRRNLRPRRCLISVKPSRSPLHPRPRFVRPATCRFRLSWLRLAAPSSLRRRWQSRPASIRS
jgi:undecaprenyl-diphosphatase